MVQVNEQRRLGRGSKVCTRLKIQYLPETAICEPVLVEKFEIKNVPCVPSHLEPIPVSNSTGFRGVDLKDRMLHLSRSWTDHCN